MCVCLCVFACVFVSVFVCVFVCVCVFAPFQPPSNTILIVKAGADGMEDGPADMESADSRSLASLLLVQDMLRHTQEAQQDSRTDASTGCEPISEILDTRTRALLADVEGVGYVLSNQIVSAAIAQIAECRDMNEVSTCRARQSTPLVFLRLRLALFHARLMTAYSNSVKQNACPTFTPLRILCV